VVVVLPAVPVPIIISVCAFSRAADSNAAITNMASVLMCPLVEQNLIAKKFISLVKKNNTLVHASADALQVLPGLFQRILNGIYRFANAYEWFFIRCIFFTFSEH